MRSCAHSTVIIVAEAEEAEAAVAAGARCVGTGAVYPQLKLHVIRHE